jgi:Tol biopolymer transport system component
LYSHPRFSPDGRLLAFRSSPSFSNADVHTIDLASGKIHRLGLTKFNLAGFDFTTDGREIIFSTNASTWRVNISQGQPERIIWIEPGASNPSTSRRGNSLVYSQDRSDNNIWKIDLSRGPVFPSVGRLFLSSTRYEGTPQFSADGSRILFTSTRSSIGGEIWVCDADGSNPRQITSSSGADGEPPLFKGSPRWSPDGQAIAFDWTTEGHRDIYVVSVEGGKPKRLTTETSSDVRPSWSRDGRWVYFGSNRSGDWQVWKVPATGGPAVQVTKRGGREALESPDGKFVYYSKGFDIAELWKIPTEGGGDETLILDGPVQGKWAVSDVGIYFIAVGPAPTVKFYSFTTRQTKDVASVGGGITWTDQGFSVSSDGKQILYTHTDRAEYDLMLVENFR